MRSCTASRSPLQDLVAIGDNDPEASAAGNVGNSAQNTGIEGAFHIAGDDPNCLGFAGDQASGKQIGAVTQLFGRLPHFVPDLLAGIAVAAQNAPGRRRAYTSKPGNFNNRHVLRALFSHGSHCRPLPPSLPMRRF
jgi:hypothetical protein